MQIIRVHFDLQAAEIKVKEVETALAASAAAMQEAQTASEAQKTAATKSAADIQKLTTSKEQSDKVRKRLWSAIAAPQHLRQPITAGLVAEVVREHQEKMKELELLKASNQVRPHYDTIHIPLLHFHLSVQCDTYARFIPPGTAFREALYIFLAPPQCLRMQGLGFCNSLEPRLNLRLCVGCRGFGDSSRGFRGCFRHCCFDSEPAPKGCADELERSLRRLYQNRAASWSPSWPSSSLRGPRPRLSLRLRKPRPSRR